MESFDRRKVALSLIVLFVAWASFQVWVLRMMGLPMPLALQDSIVSNLFMLGIALLLGIISGLYMPKSRSFTVTLLIILVDAAVLSLVAVWAMHKVMGAMAEEDASYLQLLKVSLPARGAIYFLATSASGVSMMLYSLAREQRDALNRQAATAAMVKEAELQKLQLQLQPHFLFNCLNSINAMVITRPDQAQQMVQQLSDFLRTTLKRADEQWVSLEEELAYLQLYLSVERTRFGHRLEVVTTVEENCKSFKIPTLLLQPLVENAIKFGLYGTTEKVTIELEAKEGDRDIEIGISNPFDPEALPPKGSGFGISGIQRRLYLLFARNDLLQTSDSDHIFKVRLKIPKSA